MPPAEATHDATAGSGPETARRIRDAAAQLVERAYEEAAMQGLCGEGALEFALDRLRHADPDELLAGGDAGADSG